VEELTAVWQRTHGNITSVLRTLFLSAEFQQSAGLKFRRPLDFFVGTLRATGTSVGEWWLLEEMLQQLGQPPYGWNPPNGYPDAAGAWMNSSGLLARWQVAMRLTHGAFEDVYGDGGLLQTDLNAGIGQPQTAGALVDAVARRIFGTPLPPPHQAPFIAYLTDGGGGETAVTPHLRARKLASLYGLMLASPQFQWR